MHPYTLAIIDQGDIQGGAEAFILDVMAQMQGASYPKVHLLYNKTPHKSYLKRVSSMSHIQAKALSLPSFQVKDIGSWFVGMRSALSLGWYLKRKNITLIYSNTIRGHIVGTVASIITGIPIVWMLHDFTFSSSFLRLLSWRPKKVFCVSQKVKEYYIDKAPVLAQKISIIPNGVQPELFIKKTLHAIADINGEPLVFQDDKKYIGIIGRIDTWKGQDVVARAARLLRDEYGTTFSHVEFLIIGNPTLTSPQRQQYYDNLLAYVKEHQLTNVHFLGHQDIYSLLPRLDILLHASTEAEPFGRTIIEAFASGTPVIASNLGAPMDIITYGENGLLFTPGDARDLTHKIAMLLGDKHLADTLTLKGKRSVTNSYQLPLIIDKIKKELETSLN